MTTATITAPRRGRPAVPDADRRATPVRTLLTVEEADLLIRLAERRGVTTSTAVRLAVLALLAADGR